VERPKFNNDIFARPEPIGACMTLLVIKSC
jgi:hypothetical protein